VLALTSQGVDPAGVSTALEAVTHAPIQVHAMSDIDHDGALARALQAKTGEVWLIRPDAHVAAVTPADDTARLQMAVRRSLGSTDAIPSG
jgi:hypothetical protein